MSDSHHVQPSSPTSPHGRPISNLRQVGPNNELNDVTQFDSPTETVSGGSSTHEEEINNHREIGPDLYMLIVNGDKDALFCCTTWEFISTMEGSIGNNVLHIAAESGQESLLRELLLPRCCGLVKKTNLIGDLPIHSAVRAGQFGALIALTNWDKYPSSEEIGRELLGQGNSEGDTPLHIAIENNAMELALYLMGEYLEAGYQLNDRNISPLYLAIKGNHCFLVMVMLSFTKACNPDSEIALRNGKSIVHAAITAGKLDILEMILKYHENLKESLDEEGRTPLSYAAFKGRCDMVRYLLEKFPTYAYKCDKDGYFPIHNAASEGHTKVILMLRSTWSLLNSKRQNILHVAAGNGKSEVVSYLLREPAFEKLLNSKDEDGNTPLHLASTGFHPKVVCMLTWEKRIQIWLENKEGLTALDVAENPARPSPTFEAHLTRMALRHVDARTSSLSTRRSKILKSSLSSSELSQGTNPRDCQGLLETTLIIATLVATVTFAAGFTVPGGYKQSENDPYVGMAVLAHKWAFDVFVICDTAAMYTSLLAVVTLIWAQLNDLSIRYSALKISMLFLGFSLSMMPLAFLMGIYVVLRNRLWLSYFVLGMGSLLMAVFLFILFPFYGPSSSKNSVLRCFYSKVFLLLVLLNDQLKVRYR